MTRPRGAVRPYLIAALLSLGAPLWLVGSASAEPRAVIELFTSQGCSSCPAADKLIGDLARDPTLVVVSTAIDYWDYLGWKDTLALPRHTMRQRGYATMRGDREVYTPQAVINGLAHAVGSDRDAIENAIARTSGRDGALSIPVSLSVEADRVTVDIAPAKESEAVAEVWLVGVASAVPVDIKRGENRGRTVTYHNVARKWVKVGTWTGGKQSWAVPKSELKADDFDKLLVLVQAGGVETPGAMLGAAAKPLR